MDVTSPASCIAFTGGRRIASGDLAAVACAVKEHVDAAPDAAVLVFDAVSSRPVELDLRGTVEDVLARLAPAGAGEPPVRRGPGRPKLGVVPREVTLLPRHWEWLATQPGGASATLWRLVEDARRASAGPDTVREARESAYRFMYAAAGDEPGFEEASRALFAGDARRFESCVVGWPRDLREHALALAAASFGTEAP